MVSIHPPFSGYPQSPDPTLTDPQWLSTLEKHSIFSQAQPLHPHPDHADVSLNLQPDHFPAGSTNPSLLAIRNTDLLLCQPATNQIRIASLIDAKASASASSSSSSHQTYYKVLTPSQPSHLDFKVRHISVNPTGKLLAIVGDQRLSILVLPRSGYSKHVGSDIQVRSAPVGPYYHSDHATSAIAKVQWHPWGEGGTSLLVLTQDGTLREYDVARDTEEPQQSVSFLPQRPNQPYSGHSSSSYHQRASRSRSATPTAASLAASMRSTPGKHSRADFSPPASSRHHGAAFCLTADDDDSKVAVSFTLCFPAGATTSGSPTALQTREDHAPPPTSKAKTQQGAADWSSFTVFGLMRNGDIYAICPLMPRNSIIPPSYIHTLSRLTSFKVASASDPDEAGEGSTNELQLRYLSSLLKQVSDKTSEHAAQRSRSSVTPRPMSEVASRARSTSTMDLDRLSEPLGGMEQSQGPGQIQDVEGYDDVQDVPLRLHPPSWSVSNPSAGTSAGKHVPTSQGPFLLRPAPVELCDECESASCDLSWSWLTSGSLGGGEVSGPGLGALTIVGHDGRVDIGLLLDTVDARWGTVSSRGKKAEPAAKHRSNRYAFSDTEDDLDDSSYIRGTSEVPASSLPTLLVYETIDLGLLSTLAENRTPRIAQSAASELLLKQSSAFRPSIVRDPLYSDTIYIYHSLGAHCLSMSKWSKKLLEAISLPSEDEIEEKRSSALGPAAYNASESQSRESALTKVLHQGQPSEVAWIVQTSSGPETGQVDSDVLNPITSICILSDVYLSYSLLAVTSDLQLVAMELSLRIQVDDLLPLGLPSVAKLGEESTASSASKPYVSLLGDGPPFNPPPLFDRSGSLNSLPSQPRRAGLSSAKSSSEIVITPETLRGLGKTVEGFRTEIRDVVKAGNTVQARLDLQVREMGRMLERLDMIRKRTEVLLGASTTQPMNGVGASKKEELESRLKRVGETQRLLVARTDRTLQRLMDHHQPSLSVYEKRWFDELARIAADVGIRGEGGDEEEQIARKKGLTAKADQLAHQLSLLRPSLQALAEECKRRSAEPSSSSEEDGGAPWHPNQRLGSAQLRKVEAMLANEASLLSEARSKVLEINSRISRTISGGAGTVASLI
ncbi:hypothetical protein IE53DRAFT_381867 [Violaceomyces palustris]|uniref:Uncharacterized protein n=1 Tax=Violaceomyces palustris TaxID=1673888 RepID=A0ACD0NPK2_9BASI|nr:hypothetical protein IE53DRAFT_381867 [Violaceomyces palustris]